MNHDLRRQAIAVIEGRSASVDTKLDLLLGLTVDVQTAVNGHEERLSAVEVYPETIKRVARFLVACGAVAGAIALVGAALRLL